MQTAAAYIRVSTDEQTEYSPDSQLDAIRKYAKAHDMLLPDEFIFVDEGISGRTSKKRPEFNRMIGVAKSKPKPFDVILVWKFSRFARNREDSIVYKSMLRKQCQIDVVSISENVGDDKMSVLIEALIEAMDEYYSINLAEEVKRGMTEKAKRGEPQTKPPFGYGIKDNIYIVDKKEAAVVKLIFDEFVQLGKYFPVVRLVNSMGHRTRKGKTFTRGRLEYILQNPVYIGKMRWNPDGHKGRNFTDENFIIVDAQHKAIIDENLFNQAQKIILQNKLLYAKYAKTKPIKHWLSGIIFCGDCGSVMVKSGGQYSVYQCNSYAHGGCSSHSISIRKIEQIITEQILNLTIDKNIQVEVLGGQNEKDNSDIIEIQLKQANKKLERAKQAYLGEIDTLEEYQANKSKIIAEINEIQSQRVKPKTKPQKNLTSLKSAIKHAQATLDNPESSNEEKYHALKSFIKKIVYDKSNANFQLHLYIK